MKKKYKLLIVDEELIPIKNAFGNGKISHRAIDHEVCTIGKFDSEEELIEWLKENKDALDRC